MIDGFTDTAKLWAVGLCPGRSGNANELAAMPSVHAAWSLIIAFYALRVTTSKWRYIALFHWLFTWLVIVATANHWWLDCFVAAGLMGIAVAIQGGIETAMRRRQAPVDVDFAEPVPA